MTFGLTPQGFKQERLDDIVKDLNNAFTATFGNINLSPQSVFGQIIGVTAKGYADLWENLSNVYLSQYPNSASGVSLDNVVGLNGITRLPARQTAVIGSVIGVEGTFIPDGSLAQIPNTTDIFFAQDGGIISTNNADKAFIDVTAITGVEFTVTLNGGFYFFSKPVISFVGSFVAGNSIIVSINGIPQPAVAFAGSDPLTLAAIAAQIALNPAVLSSNVLLGLIITTPVLGQSVRIDFVNVSGGVSQPVPSITFSAASSAAQVSQYLTAIINAAPNPIWTATDMIGSLVVFTTNPGPSFSVSVGTNLAITGFSSPLVFLSQNFGPVPAPQSSLTQIVTPIGGWNAITNYSPGILGRNLETDAELRIRRANSIRLFGLATVESIIAHLLTVPGVQQSSVNVFENVTLTENPIIITLSAAILPTQTINVLYNGGPTLVVPWNVSQAQTMIDLANAFLALPQVATAVVSGGDLILTVTFNTNQIITITQTGVTITGVGIAPTVSVTGGRPPKSFEAILLGGTDADIGNAIWLSKPAGIETYGNTKVTIQDSQGNNQVIFFSRPVPVYIWVSVTLTLYANETFPANGDALVAQAILAYGNSLATGEFVLLQRVNAQIFTVPGIASAIITLAATPSPTGSPSFAATDITISDTQISNFALDRIAVV
jgi:uncharacterized phage protein gp47/JayE